MPKLSVLLAAAILAVSGGALKEYRDNYHSYRDALAKFQLSREEYLKWGTLSSRDQVVSSSQEVLSQIADLLTSYFYLLQVTVEEQSGFKSEVKDLAVSIIGEHFSFYTPFMTEVSAAESLSGLEKLSLEMEADYEKGGLDARFIQASLSLAKLAEAERKAGAFAAEVKGVVEGDEQYPGRERILSEWLGKITQKLESSGKAREELWVKICEVSELEQNYQKERVLREVLEAVEEPRTLVLQVVDHLLEIVRRKKY